MGSTPWRLYNIIDDPGEINNLAQEQPDLLTGMIDEWETNWR